MKGDVTFQARAHERLLDKPIFYWLIAHFMAPFSCAAVAADYGELESD
ncbi:hypothetical protein [Microbulbifer taiwanensis]|uniref:Transposase n=1 Tax=Microbulbifer taiwanensis TaxID=986746 RepID=A0ABW1YJE5_9GAMM|nr:hypothetical protein [Microbulbifer taiwanensis]